MAPKKAIFIFIVIWASLLSASAGGHRKLVTKSTIPVGEVKKDQSPGRLSDDRGALHVHPRILVVKTNDYGKYDPSPSFSRPSFKPIPN